MYKKRDELASRQEKRPIRACLTKINIIELTEQGTRIVQLMRYIISKLGSGWFFLY